MSETLDFLTRHGPLVLFLAVFVEQMGVPLPAAPWLLAAGALAGAGKMNGVSAIAAATFGSLLADAIWFYLGRHYGGSFRFESWRKRWGFEAPIFKKLISHFVINLSDGSFYF